MASQLEGIFSWGIGLTGLLIVAAVGRQLVRAPRDNPIPHEERRRLEERYGRWAVETAVSVCPVDDVECVEREARRLSEARLSRR
ncbi:MAG: hypothetical protein SVP26_03130 [Chloroflexota bacterium]|nr:hypothetical protein [Chloroflexota bacterium]